MSNHLIPPRNEWQSHREAITTDDFPTTTSSHDPLSTHAATKRLVSYMIDASETAIEPLRLGNLSVANLEFRAKLSSAAATANLDIWIARAGDKSVKYLGRLAVTAGAQKDENGLYFARIATATSYFLSAFGEAASDEATNGIYSATLETLGYEKLWVTLDTISAGSVTVEVAGL